MSQFTIALCFFIAILAMAGTVLVLTIIYFFRQTSNRARVADASGTSPAPNTGTPPPANDKPPRAAQPARRRRFFWSRKPDAVPEKQEKPLPPVRTGVAAVEPKAPPLKAAVPPPAVKAKTSFWARFHVGGRKDTGQVKTTLNTTVYDSAVVAAAVAAKADTPPPPPLNTPAAPKPVSPAAAPAAPKFVLPKKPVPAAGVNVDLPPVSVKNIMPGTTARVEAKTETKLPPSPPPAAVAAKPAAAVNNTAVNDKNKAATPQPAAKEIKPDMNKDVKPPEKPAAEKIPAPPAAKPPASPAPAPAEAKKANDLSVLGDLSKMFAKEVVDDSEATKLAKNMKDVEINDLLKSGHDIANLLKRR